MEKQRLALYRSRENVTASIFNNSSAIDVATMATRDSMGRATVSYLVRQQSPNPSLIADQPNKGLGYNMTLRTVVATSAGKPVYEQQDALEATVSPEYAEIFHKERFAAEGRLPLVPGSYEVEVTLTNNLNLEAQRWRNHIEGSRSQAARKAGPFQSAGVPGSDGGARSGRPASVQPGGVAIHSASGAVRDHSSRPIDSADLSDMAARGETRRARCEDRASALPARQRCRRGKAAR